jgi:hypothetical protein
MRSLDEYLRVRELLDQSLSDCEIARRTGIPRCTIRDWRHKGPPGRTWARRAVAEGGCGRCGLEQHRFADLPSDAYAYLLGQYLGDGYMIRQKSTYRFGVFTDDRHPDMHDEIARAIEAVLPGPKVGRSQQVGCTRIGSHSRAWPCLFPQHGPGPKHTREIRLTDWQIEHCERAPRLLLRGLIHSDGCRCINRVTSVAGKSYEYPRYFFDNKSDDILMICAAAFQRVGVEYRWTTNSTLSVARRADVELLDTFIGPKT